MKSLMNDMFSRFNTITACDGQTDRQTSCDSIVHTVHTHRTVKLKPEKSIKTSKTGYQVPNFEI